MTTTVLSRRALIGLFAGTGLGLLVGCRDSGPSAEAMVCDAVGDVPIGLVAIGTRYRELFPDDDTTVIATDLPDDPADALGSLAARVRDDFDAGDTVDVDGWVLARTEARAAAILSGC